MQAKYAAGLRGFFSPPSIPWINNRFWPSKAINITLISHHIIRLNCVNNRGGAPLVDPFFYVRILKVAFVNCPSNGLIVYLIRPEKNHKYVQNTVVNFSKPFVFKTRQARIKSFPKGVFIFRIWAKSNKLKNSSKIALLHTIFDVKTRKFCPEAPLLALPSVPNLMHHLRTINW